MSYRAVGAGPGPVEKYKVDAPWPWGDNTEIAIPVQEMVNDAWAAARPRIAELEAQLIDDMENEMTLYAPRLVRDVMDKTVMPELNRELEITMAEFDVMKQDVTRTVLFSAAALAMAVGLGAWWLRRSR